MTSEPEVLLGVKTAQSLLWISAGALVVPLVSRRLRIPSAVGELVYGIALGPYVLKLFTRDPFIDIMAHLGFAFLMFSASPDVPPSIRKFPIGIVDLSPYRLKLTRRPVTDLATNRISTASLSRGYTPVDEPTNAARPGIRVVGTDTSLFSAATRALIGAQP